MRKTIHQLKKPIYRSAIPPQEIRQNFGDLRRLKTWTQAYYFYLGLGRINGDRNAIVKFNRPDVANSYPNMTDCVLDGKAISFGKTVNELLSGSKTVTRRLWKDSYAKRFVNDWSVGGDKKFYPALTKNYRFGGERVGYIRLTDKPYQERLADMPASELAAEGFPDLSKQQFIDKFFDGDDQQIVWVIRFAFLKDNCNPLLKGKKKQVATNINSTKGEQLLLFPLDGYKVNLFSHKQSRPKEHGALVLSVNTKHSEQLTDIKPEKRSSINNNQRSDISLIASPIQIPVDCYAIKTENHLDDYPKHRGEESSITDDYPENYPSYRMKNLSASTKIFKRGSYKNGSITEKLASDCWYTPQEIVDLVIEVLGKIDLDPCSDSLKHIPAKRHYTFEDNGLTSEWDGKVYINPPYSSPGKWVYKLSHEMYVRGTVDEAIALLPAATDTKWFETCWLETLCFWRGRIKFLNADYVQAAPARGSHVLVYFGNDPAKFARIFSDRGPIVQTKYF